MCMKWECAIFVRYDTLLALMSLFDHNFFLFIQILRKHTKYIYELSIKMQMITQYFNCWKRVNSIPQFVLVLTYHPFSYYDLNIFILLLRRKILNSIFLNDFYLSLVWSCVFCLLLFLYLRKHAPPSGYYYDTATRSKTSNRLFSELI